MGKHSVVMGLLLAWLATPAVAADHTQCTSCHTALPAAATNLARPPSALCSHCHLGRIAAGEHVVDVPVKNVPTGLGLPLQAGRITCVTCHDPHAAGLGLRLPDPSLCESCHY